MNYSIILLAGKKIYQTCSNDKKKVTLGANLKDTLQIPELKPQRLLLHCIETPVLKEKHLLTWKKKEFELNTPMILDEDKRIALLVSRVDTPLHEATITLPRQGTITFGRSTDNNVCLQDRFISWNHFTIYCDDGLYTIEDLKSENHTYVNGEMISRTRIKTGDKIDIIHAQFQVQGKLLQIRWLGQEEPGFKIIIRQSEEHSTGYEDEQTISKQGNISYEDDITISKFS